MYESTKIKRTIVPFIIVLFVIEISFAYNLDIKVFDSHGIKNVVKSYTDNIILNITISYVPDFNITKLKIDDTSADLLNAVCQKIDETTGTYRCSVDLGWLMSEKCETHYVYYGDPNFKKSITVCLDDKEPKINKLILLKKNLKSNENLTFKLDAIDQSEVITKCAGIKSVVIKFNTGSYYELKIYNQPGICAYVNNKISVALSSFDDSNLEDVSQVCFIVKDYFDQKSKEKCENITIDDTPPEIVEDSFKLVSQDRSHEYGHYFRKNTNYVVIPKIDVKENSDNVILRARFIIKNEDSSVIKEESNALASCEKKDADLFECYFNPISFNLNDDSYNLEYNIIAKDLTGNENTINGNYELLVDNVKPVVSEIKSRNSISDNYITQGSTIAVLFQEDGCGFYNKQAYISSAAFGRKAADDCYMQEGYWICLFKNINPSLYYNNKEVNIYVTGDTKDDCGNSIEEKTNKNFFVDLDKPDILGKINITNQDNELFIKEGDSVKISFVVEDFSNVYVNANFSKVTGDNSLYTKQCNPIDNKKHLCDLEVSSAKACNEDIILTIFDDANNSLEKKVHINVYARDENPSNNFWTVNSVNVSPEKTDRSLSLKMDLYAFADVEFKSRTGDNQNMVSFNIDHCDSDINAEVEALYENDQMPGDKIISFVIKIPAGTEINSEKKEINCSFLIKTKHGNQITTNPEEKNVTFVLEFYDGFINNNDAVVEKIKGTYERVKKLNDVLGTIIIPGYEILTSLCDAYDSFSGVTYTLDTTAIASSAIPGINVELHSDATEIDLDHKQVSNLLGQVCDWVQCPKSKEKVCGEIKKQKWYVEGLTSCPDPTKNIFVGILSGCYVPPIMYSIANWYYTETAKLDCYLNSIEQGYPIYMCDAVSSEYYCEYVVGNVVEGLGTLLPGFYSTTSDFFNGLGLAKEVFEDPMSATIAIITTFAPIPETYVVGVHKLLTVIEKGIETYEQVNNLINQINVFGTGYANDVLQKYEDMFGVSSEQESIKDEEEVK